MNNKYLEPEERDESADDFIDQLAKLVQEDESRTSMVNVDRMQQLKLAYEIFKKTMIGENVDISYQVNKPFPSMGNISVEADLLAISNPRMFHMIAKLANNVEIYPLTNGRVRMCFTFHGLVKPLE